MIYTESLAEVSNFSEMKFLPLSEIILLAAHILKK